MVLGCQSGWVYDPKGGKSCVPHVVCLAITAVVLLIVMVSPPLGTGLTSSGVIYSRLSDSVHARMVHWFLVKFLVRWFVRGKETQNPSFPPPHPLPGAETLVAECWPTMLGHQ